MYKLLIKVPGKGDALATLAAGSYLVGAGADCHIRLARPEISGKHAQFIVRNNRLTVVDLESCNGTYIDKAKLPSNTPQEVGVGSVIAIGEASIHVRGPEVKEAPPSPEPSGEKKTADAAANVIGERIKEAIAQGADEHGKQKIPLLKISGIGEDARPIVQTVKKRAQLELLKRLNLKKMALSGVSEHDLESRAATTIREILSELTIPLPKKVKLETIEKELLQEAIGLGPLEYLINLEDVTEIMVNGPNNVYVECDGILYRTDTAFADNSQVQAAIERIVSPLGRRIDESSPMVDARLANGSRVNAIIPPLSLVGPTITIRKFSKTPFKVKDLVRFGSLSREMADFLEACVKVRKNIIISGGTGSGKTTLLNVLSSFLPNRERIVTIEDAAELQLNQEHVVRLESRPPNIEGRGEITIRDLVRNALRMRPDRIVVGECRGGEALDMLQAMNTGHDGSLTTVHANSPRDALSRLETLVLMAGFDLPLRAIREQICSAIDIIVQINRERDGSRKVSAISEITKMEGEVVTMQDIFVYRQDGWNADNKIVGEHLATGNIPTFMEDIQRAKIPLDIKIFSRNIGRK